MKPPAAQASPQAAGAFHSLQSWYASYTGQAVAGPRHHGTSDGIPWRYGKLRMLMIPRSDRESSNFTVQLPVRLGMGE
jgi:hypothetical protein